MKSNLECILCYGRSALFLTERFALPEEKKEALIRALLREIADSDFNDPPPVNARRTHEVIFAFTGEADPFKEEKDRSTAYAKLLLEQFQADPDFLKGDSFEKRVRLAIAGNIIDYGVNSRFDLESAKDQIRATLEEDLEKESLDALRNAMEKANKILYITDNCGEAVFDTLLMQEFREKITCAVRGRPTLNDVTMAEAIPSGLDKACMRLIDTGDNTPGIDLKRSSPEFLESYRNADLVIAKGQGHFETLCEEKEQCIFFLFRAKCPVVAERAGGVPLGKSCIRIINAHGK